jgi:integrase
VALAIYTYTRDAELRVLRWSDIDHGIVDITRAFNRRNPREVKGTKSDAPRRFAVEANLLPLLEAMRSTDGTALVVKLPSERAMARNLRRWLVKAGVTRAALHKGSDTSQNITWHDLRATGATWMAVRGDDAHKIMQRCGHKSFSTTDPSRPLRLDDGQHGHPLARPEGNMRHVARGRQPERDGHS